MFGLYTHSLSMVCYTYVLPHMHRLLSEQQMHDYSIESLFGHITIIDITMQHAPIQARTPDTLIYILYYYISVHYFY